MRQQLTLVQLRNAWALVKETHNERQRRLWAAEKAIKNGRGGISLVSKATGLARDTIRDGIRQLNQLADTSNLRRIRVPGGGRKRLVDKDSKLLVALDKLIEPLQESIKSPVRWTCQSTRQLAHDLRRQGHPIRDRSVAGLLRAAGYDLRAVGGRPQTKKSSGEAKPPDRNAQFESLNARVQRFHRQRQPVIVVEALRRMTIGALVSVKQRVSTTELPASTKLHVDPALHRSFPPDLSDIRDHRNWRSVDIDHEGALFVVSAIRCWWSNMGSDRFPRARRLLIAADIGALDNNSGPLPNALQNLADDLGIVLEVCDTPRATRRWDFVKQILGSFTITKWRGKPMLHRQAAVRLIGRTEGSEPLDVRAVPDSGECSSVADATADVLSITPGDAAGVWIVRPKTG